MAIKEDYYKVLGILCDAADADIKKAYRIQARQHHPDKAEDKEAAHALFVKIGEAYDVLSNPKKRTDYDYFLYEYHCETVHPDPDSERWHDDDYYSWNGAAHAENNDWGKSNAQWTQDASRYAAPQQKQDATFIPHFTSKVTPQLKKCLQILKRLRDQATLKQSQSKFKTDSEEELNEEIKQCLNEAEARVRSQLDNLEDFEYSFKFVQEWDKRAVLEEEMRLAETKADEVKGTLEELLKVVKELMKVNVSIFKTAVLREELGTKMEELREMR